VPWHPKYTREEAAEAITASATWADALRYLGLSPFGKNFGTLRKWAQRWNLEIAHLTPYRARRSTPRFTEEQAREAIRISRSWTEALRRLGYCPTGGNPGTLKKWAATWGIRTDHFDPHAASIVGLKSGHEKKPLDQILVESSTFSRSNLKQRLYDEGVKRPVCELCGQNETWNGRRLSLILDHINGIRNDNRLENLRIICPNCAATLETHCGRKLALPLARACARCGTEFRPKYRDHRYCSRECGSRWDRAAAAARGKGQFGRPRPHARKVDRPPYDQLIREIAATSYLAVGRKHGVSDNAVRKWVAFYERQMERDAARSVPGTASAPLQERPPLAGSDEQGAPEAELPRDRDRVGVAPVLGDPAVLEAADRDPRQLDAAPVVRAVHRPVGRDAVTVGHLLLDGEAQIGEDAPVERDGFPRASVAAELHPVDVVDE
jgi:transposase-like protein